MTQNIKLTSEAIIIFTGIIISFFGLYTASLSIRSFVPNVPLFANLTMYGLCFMPLFLGLGLLGLGMKWNKKIVLSSLTLCGLGIFFYLLFIILLIAGVFN